MFSDHNTSVGLWVYSAPQGWALFSVIAAPAPVWSCDIKQEVSGAFAWLRQGGLQAIMRNWAATLAVCKPLSQPCFRIMPTHIVSLQMESRLPKTFQLAPPALQPAKGPHLPCVRLQDGSVQYFPTTSSWVWVSAHLPFPESPHRGTCPNLMASLPFLPASLQIFLTALVVQVFLPVSVSFQWKLVHM